MLYETSAMLMSLFSLLRQHTSAYVSIREHT
jgi:hypothetical protein